MSTSDEHWNGRNGQVFGGGNWDDFVRGQNERRMWEERTGPTVAPSYTPSSGGGVVDVGGNGGGGGLGALGILLLPLLAVALVALVFALSASLSALLGGLLLVIAVKIWRPSAAELDYGSAFRTAFYAIISFTLAYMATGGLAYFMAKDDVQPGLVSTFMRTARDLSLLVAQSMTSLGTAHDSLTLVMNYLREHGQQTGLVLGALAYLHGPGLLLGAIVLNHRLSPPFGGFIGYLKALLTTIAAVLPSMLLTTWTAVLLVERARPLQLSTSIDQNTLVITGLAVLAYAMLGGLVAAAVLFGLLRWTSKTARPSFSRCYSRAFKGLLWCALLTLGGLYLFRDGDELVGWLVGCIGADDPAVFLMANTAGLTHALRSFLPVQLPGLLVCAGVIVGVQAGAFKGLLGYAKACGLMVLLCLPTMLPFIGAAMKALLTRVDMVPLLGL